MQTRPRTLHHLLFIAQTSPRTSGLDVIHTDCWYDKPLSNDPICLDRRPAIRSWAALCILAKELTDVKEIQAGVIIDIR